MALSKLSEDQHRSIFGHLWNVLEPRFAVEFSSISCELWALTQELRKQLRSECEAVAALCRKVGMRSSKELREAREFGCSLRSGRPDVAGQAGIDAASARVADPLRQPSRRPRRRAAAGGGAGRGRAAGRDRASARPYAYGRRRRFGACRGPGPRRPAGGSTCLNVRVEREG